MRQIDIVARDSQIISLSFCCNITILCVKTSSLILVKLTQERQEQKHDAKTLRNQKRRNRKKDAARLIRWRKRHFCLKRIYFRYHLSLETVFSPATHQNCRQFHQRWTSKFFVRKSFLAAFLVTFWLWWTYESTFVRKIRAFNVDEIDTLSPVKVKLGYNKEIFRSQLNVYYVN